MSFFTKGAISKAKSFSLSHDAIQNFICVVSIISCVLMPLTAERKGLPVKPSFFKRSADIQSDYRQNHRVLMCLHFVCFVDTESREICKRPWTPVADAEKDAFFVPDCFRCVFDFCVSGVVSRVGKTLSAPCNSALCELLHPSFEHFRDLATISKGMVGL